MTRRKSRRTRRAQEHAASPRPGGKRNYVAATAAPGDEFALGLLDLFTSGLDRIKDDGPNLAEERVSLTLSTLDEYAGSPTLTRIIAAAQTRGTEADLNALAVLARLAPGPAMREAAAQAARAVQSRHNSGRTGTWLRDLSPVRFTGGVGGGRRLRGPHAHHPAR